MDREGLDAVREDMATEYREAMAAYEAEKRAMETAYWRLSLGVHIGAVAVAVLFAAVAMTLLPWWLAVPLILAWIVGTGWAITPRLEV